LSIVGRMSASSTHVPLVLACGTVLFASGSLAWLPSAGVGPSMPLTATPGPAIAAQVTSMFGL
jgi:hypothetical protein